MSQTDPTESQPWCCSLGAICVNVMNSDTSVVLGAFVVKNWSVGAVMDGSAEDIGERAYRLYRHNEPEIMKKY